jgi:hypothetical protein
MRIFLLACAVFSIVAAPVSAERRDPARNAALQYWRAFEFEKAAVPKEGGFTNSHQLISEALQGRFTTQTEEYFRRVEQYLDLMRLGAAQPYCEWGPHSHPLEIPHLMKGRSLGRLAAARFRHLAASGQEESATDLFRSAFQMAEHMDDTSLGIGILIKQASHGILINAAAAELPGLTRNTLASIATIIEENRPPYRLGETFLNDYNFLLRQLRADVLQENLTAVSERLQTELGFPSSLDTDELLDKIRQLELQVQKISEILTQQDLSAAQNELQKLANDADGFEKVLLGTASSMVRHNRSAKVRLAMLRAAIATMLDGQEALANFPEPDTGKPFQYEPQFRDRFLLRSAGPPEPGLLHELQIGQLDTIHHAVAAGDLEQVRYHLKTGTQLDRRDSKGWTPLHYAAQHGNLKLVELLVEAGAGLDAGTLEGSTMNINPVLAQRYGLSPPPPGKNTQTALDLAIVSGHDMVAAFLREKGARTGEVLWKKTRGTLAKRALEMRLAFDNPGEDTEQFHLITRSPGDQPSRRQVLHLQNETLLEESDIQTARVKNDPVTGSPHIELIFTYEGSTKFARITGENIGQKLAIIVDGEIISAPVIRAAISGGSAIISGDFTESEAGELARKITETTSSPGDVD